MIQKSLIDKIANQIKPPEIDTYYFKLLRLNKDGTYYIGIVHGEFSGLLKDYKGWKELKKIEFVGPESWTEDFFNDLVKELSNLQINSYSSPIPLYRTHHQEDVFEVLKEKLIQFNTSYLRTHYETTEK